MDNARNLYWTDVATGATKKVGGDHFYGPVKTLRPAWSPDSRWIAYAVNNKAYIQNVRVYSLDQDKSFPVTDGLSDAGQPVFDRSGKYLYFFASTNAGPVNNWFTLENEPNRVTRAIYLAVLRKDLPSPLVKESDEEKAGEESEPSPDAPKKKGVDDEKPDAKADETRDRTDVKSDEKPKAAPVVSPVRIDFDGLAYRILDLPVAEAELMDLQPGEAGQVFFLRTRR